MSQLHLHNISILPGRMLLRRSINLRIFGSLIAAPISLYRWAINSSLCVGGKSVDKTFQPGHPQDLCSSTSDSSRGQSDTQMKIYGEDRPRVNLTTLRAFFPKTPAPRASARQKVMIINHRPNLIIQMIYDWNASALRLGCSHLVSLSCNKTLSSLKLSRDRMMDKV